MRWPFISPDSHWIGFFGQGELRKVSMTGGPSVSVCRIQGLPIGASWGPDNTIVFATTDSSTGLLSVPAAGGEPKALTQPDPAQNERDHAFPSVLPDGRAVLFTIISGPIENAQVAVLDLQTGRTKTLFRGGSQAEYVETGHLIYAAGSTLRAVRFDPHRLEVLGESVPVVEGVADQTSQRHGRFQRVSPRHARLRPGVRGQPAAHAGVGGPQGSRGTHTDRASRLYVCTSGTGRHAHRARHPRSAERYLDLEFCPPEPPAPDDGFGQQPFASLDARQPAGGVHRRARRCGEYVLAGGRRVRHRGAPEQRDAERRPPIVLAGWHAVDFRHALGRVKRSGHPLSGGESPSEDAVALAGRRKQR